jgi:putative ABC transport system permease protein
MKYLHLLLKNLLRKKTRTLLTLGSFAVAMFLFGLLSIVKTSFAGGVDVAGADRLLVINRVSIIQPLPLSYRDQMLQMPGVQRVTYANWFGGIYQDERNFFPQYAIDLPTYRTVYPEFLIPDDQWKAFEADREGCVVGVDIAKRFKWKLGDRVPIKATIHQGTWEFNIRGIYKGKRDGDDNTQFWFRADYLEERRVWGKGTVGWYTVQIDNPDNATRVIHQIDSKFANSAFETKTDTEKSFAAGWVKQMGNIGMLVTVIGSVVFFTLLLVTGNTMAMAVRERIRELAILKALGFTDRFVLMLVLAESMLIALIGGVIGLGAVKLITLGGDPTRGLIQFFFLKTQTLVTGVVLALCVGFVAGILPAFNASRLRVVDALRRV